MRRRDFLQSAALLPALSTADFAAAATAFDYEHYQDDGVYYDRRPSAWVEPKAGWASGSIQLVELTAPNETFDNIVAYWNPAAPPQPGDELLYSYRTYWGTRMPAGQRSRIRSPPAPVSAVSWVTTGSISRGASRSTPPESG